MAVLADKIEIRIDGEKMDEDYAFSDIQLVQELQKPNEFHFLMHRKEMIEDEQYIRFSLSKELLGKSVEYFLSTMRDDDTGKTHTDVLEFSGIIFKVNLLRQNIKAGMVIEVTAYSPDYLLCDNAHCWSYEDETLKNIVAKTLESYDNIPLQNNPRIDREILYTVQYNENNYAFLSRLARRYGEWLYYNGKELIFGKVDKLNGMEPLHLGYDITKYQYRIDMKPMNFTHAHHNYLDYGNTKNAGYNATEDEMHNLTDIAYDASKTLYTKETFQHLKGSTQENSFDETEFSVSAQGLGQKAQMLVCEGTSNRADLKIGSVFKIKEYYDKGFFDKGICFHDELLIHKITHTTDIHGNYENTFTAIPATCEAPPHISGDNFPKVDSQTQRAVVKDNQDPEKLGRIRVQFLWQKEQDDTMLSPWLRITQPHGGDDKGFYFIPEIGEEVMVGFENGNAEKPYAIGTLYHGDQRPGKKWYSETNDIKAIRTRNGHTIEIHDVDGNGFIRIYDYEKENYILTFSTDEKVIKLESTGNIELYAEKDIIMKAGNNINMEADVDMIRKAGKNINESAKSNITVRASGNMNESAGSNITVHAGKNMNIGVDKNMELNVQDNRTTNIGNDDTFTVGNDAKSDIGNDWRIEAENDITISADNDSTILAKNMELSVDEELDMNSSQTIAIEGSQEVGIKGATIKIS